MEEQSFFELVFSDIEDLLQSEKNLTKLIQFWKDERALYKRLKNPLTDIYWSLLPFDASVPTKSQKYGCAISALKYDVDSSTYAGQNYLTPQIFSSCWNEVLAIYWMSPDNFQTDRSKEVSSSHSLPVSSYFTASYYIINIAPNQFADANKFPINSNSDNRNSQEPDLHFRQPLNHDEDKRLTLYQLYMSREKNPPTVWTRSTFAKRATCILATNIALSHPLKTSTHIL